MVRDLQLNVQGHDIVLPVYLLTVTGANLVLVIAWLATLGSHTANYETMTFKFCLKGQFITLYGNRKNIPRRAKFHQVRRLVQIDVIVEVFTL